MKTECRWSIELSAYWDGELADSRKEKLVAHLQECSVCREQLAFLKSTSHWIQAIPDEMPSEYLWTRIQSRLGKTSSVRVHLWEQPWVARLLPNPVQSLVVALILMVTFFSIQPFLSNIDANLSTNSITTETDINTLMTSDNPETLLGIQSEG